MLLAIQTATAQHKALKVTEQALDRLRETAPLEKLHLQFDKSSYILGDTLWYKAYVLDGFMGAPSLRSGIVYVELVDGEGELVQRSRLVVLGGSAHGEFVLDPAVAKAGRFMVRAYTRWLLNFGEDFFCHQYIDVFGDYHQEWAIDMSPVNFVDSADGSVLDMAMVLRSVDGTRFEPQPVTVELRDNGRPVSSQLVLVDGSGALATQLKVPKRTVSGDMEVVLRSYEEVRLRFPLTTGMVNAHYDVQFLPESGYWLADIPAVMGVKAVDQDGLGVRAKGVVVAPDGTEVANFDCVHKGMGRVALPPLPVGNYQARVTFPDGAQATYPLPGQKTKGLALHYSEQLSTPERFAVQVLGTDAAFVDGLVLVGFARGAMCYGISIKKGDNLLYVNVKKDAFPEGIVHFSLLDAAGKPLASRMVYNHRENRGLSIQVSPHRQVYGKRDSIALHVKVTDADGQPVRGNFAMGVTDDGRYHANRLEETIRTRYLLSSELQGYIEDPGFYLAADSGARMAVDNLLLTQGWVRYDQSLLPKVAKFTHPPEPFFRIAGTVSNGFGKPLGNTEVSLAAIGKNAFMMDTVADENGVFRFQQFPLFDSLGFVITAKNKRGRSFNVRIELAPDVERMVTPNTDWRAGERLPWYVNLNRNTQRAVIAQREHLRNTIYGTEGGDLKMVMLEEANVTGRRVIKGSTNLNGPGNADQVIDEEELMEHGTKTLLQILAEQVEGFQVGRFPRSRSGKPAYMVFNRPVRIIFDGMDIERFYDPVEGMPENDHLLFVKGHLQGYTVDELVGIEVMSGAGYSSRYNSYFLHGSELVASSGQAQIAQPGPGAVNPLSRTSAVMGLNPVYINITTRSGMGLYDRRTPGVVHFRPMPFAWPRDFYKPRYPVAWADKGIPDLRSTIHWEPFIITNEQGEATISFYAGDLLGSYTIRMQGLDDKGNLGVLHQQLPILE
ncbi:hypothetical protein GCM10007415_46950 [Parapedobacter pyrenivorans]|uniref:MG2 domain-containing protein n=2 Tax=Parapedobacter pyrenivorans TaxID=1305674 RepID=A0A917I208_9SPHI|nr:hypothetical protein GCM10007415_46950 [Parapedobacter pyrenivorans]